MKLHLKTDFRTRPPRVFKRGASYYIRQRINGKDVWRSLYTTVKAEAETLAYRIWYYQQSEGVRESLFDTPDISLAFAWTNHIATDRYQLLAPSTKHTREVWWNAFSDYCSTRNITGVHHITPELITAFLDGRGAKNKTFNNARAELMQILRPAFRRLEMSDPFLVVEPKTIRRGERASEQFRAFSDAEIKTILAGLKNSKMKHRMEWVSACNIALYTGLRFKDVALSRWSAIKGKYEYLEIVPFKTASKTKKAVLISIIPEFRELLENLPSLKKSVYLLPGLAEKYNEKESSKRFVQFLHRLEITDTDSGKAGFHSFRATVTTKASDAGINLKEFGGVLGHATEAQTQHYNKAALTLDLSFLSQQKRSNNVAGKI